MLKLEISKKSGKYIRNLLPKHQKQVIKSIVRLQTNTKPSNSKKLTGYNLYRVRSGEYRIVYSWNTSTVFVVVVGKRNDSDVYKKLRKSK